MKVAIFGAGQAGVMAAKWLPANQKLICFIDTNKKTRSEIVRYSNMFVESGYL